MDTKKTRAFIETVRTGSINKAANELGYTHSGLTYVLNSLEDEVGIKLFERGYNGIALTAEGEELYPLLVRLYEDEMRFNERLNQIKDHTSGIIRIGLYSSLLVSWMPKVTAAFKKAHPEVKFEMRTGVVSIKQWLDNDTVDIALCEQHLVEGYAWQKLMDDEMWVAAYTGLPVANERVVTLEMLRDYPVIFPNINRKNAVSLRLEELGISYPNQTDIYTEDGSITLSMVQQTHGVSFVARMYEAECPASVRMIPIDPPIARSIGVAVNKNMSGNKLLRSLINTMKRTSAY